MDIWEGVTTGLDSPGNWNAANHSGGIMSGVNSQSRKDEHIG